MNSPYPNSNEAHSKLLSDRIKSIHEIIARHGHEIRECRRQIAQLATIVIELKGRIEDHESSKDS